MQKNPAATASDIITALKALPVSGKDKSKVNEAIKYIENIQGRGVIDI